MKAVIFALAVAGVASTAPLNAQINGSRHPVSTTRTTSVDGSWRVVGQDGYGTIYERRTYDANGNIVVQRARRDANGNFSILGTRTVQGNNGSDCQLSTGATVGGIILGRTGAATNCGYNGSAVDGVWRQVGQGRNNNSIYERRTIDANGNVVIQRARRNPDGTFTILSTRTRGNNGVRNRGRGDDDDQGEDNDNGRGRRGRHSDDNSGYNNDDSRYNNGSNYGYNNSDDSYSSDDNRYTNSEHKNNGRGKGKKGRD